MTLQSPSPHSDMQVEPATFEGCADFALETDLLFPVLAEQRVVSTAGRSRL